MDEIIDTYKNIWQPKNFIKLFKDKEEFKEWARSGTKEDVYLTIKIFEKEELYEWCEILYRIYTEM